jgi:hypothetical protein
MKPLELKQPETLYGKYLSEREGKFILEKPYGFATYEFGEDYVYIIDIYVVKEQRQHNKAASMADEIANIAKSQGKKSIIGSVDQTANGATISMKVLLGYGFSLLHLDKNMIYFKKEI